MIIIACVFLSTLCSVAHMTLPADVNEEEMGGKTRLIQGKSVPFVLFNNYYYY